MSEAAAPRNAPATVCRHCCGLWPSATRPCSLPRMSPARVPGGWLLCVAVLASSAAHAHAHLKGSTPQDGSSLAKAPTALVLDFSEPARLTAAWIEKRGADKQKLAPLPQQPAAEISIALPPLAPGDYLVSWRARGDDGHVVPGQIRFTVRQ